MSSPPSALSLSGGSAVLHLGGTAAPLQHRSHELGLVTDSAVSSNWQVAPRVGGWGGCGDLLIPGGRWPCNTLLLRCPQQTWTSNLMLKLSNDYLNVGEKAEMSSRDWNSPPGQQLKPVLT